jgi:lipoprotein signal peptidase
MELRPDQVVFNTGRRWHVIPVAVVIGGGLGNMGELAILSRVTDFIPLGIPFRRAVWSPADLFLAAGLVLVWIGAAQYPRARALQARDPLHGRRRRPRRQGDALPGDS